MFGRLAAAVAASIVIAGADAGTSQDLPARESFLREASDAVTRSQSAWHRYAYIERSTELHLNPFGRMGMGPTRVFEVWPSPNPKLTRRRLIERNGVKVSQQELDRQDAEYLSRVKSASGSSAREQTAERREADDLLAKRRAELITEDVVNTLQFDLARREFRDGRAAIVVTFAARPGARPVTREGQLTRVFRGEIWVDDATREVTDVRVVAMDDVSFGGFIAK